QLTGRIIMSQQQKPSEDNFRQLAQSVGLELSQERLEEFSVELKELSNMLKEIDDHFDLDGVEPVTTFQLKPGAGQ
ncbi:hypothetical protein ACFLVI_04390, partial [Chloroflexota bacterium]